MRQSRIELPEVGTGASHHNAEFGGRARIEISRFDGTRQLDGLFRMTEGALAIGHHRQLPGATGHPTSSPQFRNRLGPLAGVIGHQPDRLPDHSDAAALGPGRPGVSPRQCRIFFGEHPGHEQVGADELATLLAQAPQIPADFRVQFSRVSPLGDLRPAFADLLFTHSRATVGLTSLVARRFTVRPGCRAGIRAPSGAAFRAPVLPRTLRRSVLRASGGRRPVLIRSRPGLRRSRPGLMSARPILIGPTGWSIITVLWWLSAVPSKSLAEVATEIRTTWCGT